MAATGILNAGEEYDETDADGDGRYSYPDTAAAEEQRRAWIIECFAVCAAEMTLDVFFAFVKGAEAYIKDGAFPQKREKPKAV
jgi:hypothetical protein